MKFSWTDAISSEAGKQMLDGNYAKKPKKKPGFVINRFKFGFWVLQVVAVSTALSIITFLYDNAIYPPARIGSGMTDAGDLVEILLVLLFCLVVKGRFEMSRELSDVSLIGLWEFDDSFFPFTEDVSLIYGNSVGYVMTLVVSILLVILHGAAFAVGFDNVFFGERYSFFAWSMIVLFVIGAIADVVFEFVLQGIKNQNKEVA